MFVDPRFEEEAIAALMEEALTETKEETKFDVDDYINNSNLDYWSNEHNHSLLIPRRPKIQVHEFCHVWPGIEVHWTVQANPSQGGIKGMNDQLVNDATEIMLVLEDTVEYLCSEHMLSGEKVWVMVGALADAKLKEFPNEDS